MSDGLLRPALALKCATVIAVLAGLICAAACGGGDAANTGRKVKAENVSADDVERDLKFDARVSDFDTDGNKLIVNVNQQWMSSPAGMQQTAVQRWLTRWQASKASDGGAAPKDTQVVVRYEGNDILTATGNGEIKVAKAAAESESAEAK
ncbi:MAG: hypothetical protein DMF61_15685 [Blastocatellia bacterium AA13]|nr:MAG: hypothetical protein DMF61_15685 [Blastocatellia bacterium AA13]